MGSTQSHEPEEPELPREFALCVKLQDVEKALCIVPGGFRVLTLLDDNRVKYEKEGEELLYSGDRLDESIQMETTRRGKNGRVTEVKLEHMAFAQFKCTLRRGNNRVAVVSSSLPNVVMRVPLHGPIELQRQDVEFPGLLLLDCDALRVQPVNGRHMEDKNFQRFVSGSIFGHETRMLQSMSALANRQAELACEKLQRCVKAEPTAEEGSEARVLKIQRAAVEAADRLRTAERHLQVACTRADVAAAATDESNAAQRKNQNPRYPGEEEESKLAAVRRTFRHIISTILSTLERVHEGYPADMRSVYRLEALLHQLRQDHALHEQAAADCILGRATEAQVSVQEMMAPGNPATCGKRKRDADNWRKSWLLKGLEGRIQRAQAVSAAAAAEHAAAVAAAARVREEEEALADAIAAESEAAAAAQAGAEVTPSANETVDSARRALEQRSDELIALLSNPIRRKYPPLVDKASRAVGARYVPWLKMAYPSRNPQAGLEMLRKAVSTAIAILGGHQVILRTARKILHSDQVRKVLLPGSLGAYFDSVLQGAVAAKDSVAKTTQEQINLWKDELRGHEKVMEEAVQEYRSAGELCDQQLIYKTKYAPAYADAWTARYQLHSLCQTGATCPEPPPAPVAPFPPLSPSELSRVGGV